MGTTLREVVEEIGGGVPGGHTFKAAQTGGPSGGCIPAKLIDTPIDYDNLIAIGSMMGSGGLIVMDETTCMVDIAKFFLEFTVDESCGKCTPCRVGTKRSAGDPEQDHLWQRHPGGHRHAWRSCATTSRRIPCAAWARPRPTPCFPHSNITGMSTRPTWWSTAAPPGPAKPSPITHIVADKCKGCTLCARNCPVGAISGSVKQPHVIDTTKCIKCGVCMEKCKFGAVVKK